MQIFEFRQDTDHYRPWRTFDGSIDRISDTVPHGNPVASTWQERHGRVYEIRGLREGDFPYWVDPVFSAAARTALSPTCGSEGEWLPLQTDGTGEFFVFNVTTVIDCLDEARSKLKRFDDGSVYGATWLEFDPAKVQSLPPCFRIPHQYIATFYVTDRFVDAVEQAGLRGFAPIEVWDSELGGRELGLGMSRLRESSRPT